MKKLTILCMMLSILVGLMCPVAAVEEDISVLSGCHSLKANMPLAGQEQLLPSADGVILYELNTKTLVYAFEPDDRVNPSSMVKILAALVALEKGDLNDVVTVQRSTLDSVPIGSVSAGLLRDEQVPMLDLIYCCLVASANDATAVMAEHIAGSQDAFVEMMNQKAKELGCSDSFFSNVNGLNDNMQYSTARDLAIITAAALENKTFEQIFCTKNYTMPATNLSGERSILTTNYMMSDEKVKGYLDGRVLGGKTAAATHTKRSLICTAEIGTARYLSVVMSADSVMSEDNISVISFGSFKETAQLLDHAQTNYEVRQILEASQAFSQLKVAGGMNDVTLAPMKDVFSVLPINCDPATLEFLPEFNMGAIEAPVAAGQKIGAIRVSCNGIVLTRCPLAAMFAVERENTVILPAAPISPDEMDKTVSHFIMWALIGVGGLFLLVAIVLLSRRLVHNARIRHLYRKRKRNRRRSR